MKTTDDQSELFIIVDKNDKIISYKTRAECRGNKNLIRRLIGVVIFNAKHEILLQKRSLTKDIYPGYYTISCSGHPTKGETYDRAAQREINEELGITDKLKLNFIKKIINSTDQAIEMLAIFTANYNGPINYNRIEVDKIEVLSGTKIKQLFVKNRLLLTPCARITLQELKII